MTLVKYSPAEQYDDGDSVMTEAEGDNTDICIMADILSWGEYESGDWDIGYQREIIDGVTVYYGGDLDDSDDSDWEDPEDVARREYVEQHNFVLLKGMQPMVFVPSSAPSRVDRRNSRGACLYDGNDNRIYGDESVVDQERETWREYCASLFRKGLAPFPSHAAVSPLTGLRRNEQYVEADNTDMVLPECVVGEAEIDAVKTLVLDDDDDTSERVLPIPMEMPVSTVDSDIVSAKDQIIEVPELSLTVWNSRFRSGFCLRPI